MVSVLTVLGIAECVRCWTSGMVRIGRKQVVNGKLGRSQRASELGVETADMYQESPARRIHSLGTLIRYQQQYCEHADGIQCWITALRATWWAVGRCEVSCPGGTVINDGGGGDSGSQEVKKHEHQSILVMNSVV